MATETGSWGPQNLSAFSQVNFFEYLAPVSGEYSVSVSTTGLATAVAPDYLVINKNGSNVDPSASTSPPNRSYTGNFIAGDIINATALVMAARTNVTASWTITAPSGPLTPVTPQEPTFLDEAPWVVLPTQVGVTYSTSGTPGWDSSVTVTATADEGYVITGWFTWTKTWDARPLPSNALIQEGIDMVYFGNQWAEALYKGGMVVWEFVTPKITTFSLMEMEEGQYFSQQINTNFEVVSWSAEGLPAGLSLSQSGLLSGTPAAESFGFVTITANGIGPRTAQESYMWSVVKGGPLSDAAIYLDFESSANFLKNKGVSQNIIPSVSLDGTVLFYKDHAQFRDTGRFTAELQSTWDVGYTLTSWVRNIAAGTDWRTIMHRAKGGAGPYTNETYFVFNTLGENSYLFSGLKHQSNHREAECLTPISAGSDWTHVGVRWRRASSTTWACAFFINGQFISETTHTGFSPSDTYAPDENVLRLGGDFIGDADDMAMWRRALTNEEVVEVYNSGRTSVPQITTFKVNEMKATRLYSQQFTASFPVTTWSATGVPPGLTFSSTGLLSGTPTQATSGSMTVTATGGGITDQTTLPWSVSSLVSINVPFNSNGDIDFYFPIRGFDGRTSASSWRNAGWTFNGMLVAGDNNQPTYWQILHGSEMPAEKTEWTLTTGDVMNTVARPTEIILSSTADYQYQLLLQIGSGNLNLVSRTTGSTTNLRTLSRTIGTNSSIRVVRNGLSYTVYHNNTSVYTYTGTTSNAAAWFRTPGRAYTGITLYSTSGQWSSRVAHFNASETG